MNVEKSYTAELFDCLRQMDGIYSAYAKSVGMNYTSMYIFYYISYTDGCTQKSICEQLFLPKQTVNTIVKGFCQDGIVELAEAFDDRRQKTLHLTRKGQELADKILKKIDSAENASMEQFSVREKELFISIMKKYISVLAREMRIKK